MAQEIKIAYPGFGGSYSWVEAFSFEDQDERGDIIAFAENAWSKEGVIVTEGDSPLMVFKKGKWSRWGRKDRMPEIS